ncbi:MAG: calcium/sodium antiporter [Deltaproteobacteria bacterium]|nr:calcium/sodium antiporter [Deltaproteobacteria bacterium]
MPTALAFALGLLSLVLGGELLVKGASRMAALLRISPLVVGLTVVAYGTSSPELATNLIAVYENKLDIAVGNVVGSNILNVFFILGVSALIAPLVVHRQVVRLDVPIMIAASALLLLLGIDGKLSRFDGLLLLGSVVFYTVFIIRESRRETSNQEEAGAAGQRDASRSKAWLLSAILVLAGLGFLALGSNWLVDAAIVLAKRVGVSEMIIGLTVVAAGTSLPEIITSIIAALRGQRDIAVGNVVGSNIYNILAILGLSGVLAKDGIPFATSTLGFDIPVMIGAAVACLPIFFTGHRIARWEGALFLAYYVAYTLFLVLRSLEHDGLPLFSGWMLGYVLPITAITLMIFFLREMVEHSRKSAKGGLTS